MWQILSASGLMEACGGATIWVRARYRHPRTEVDPNPTLLIPSICRGCRPQLSSPTEAVRPDIVAYDHGSVVDLTARSQNRVRATRSASRTSPSRSIRRGSHQTFAAFLANVREIGVVDR